MKRINNILDGTDASYPFVGKLSLVLEPFALFAVGRMPIYIGNPVESLSTKECQDCGVTILCINGEELAAIDLQNKKASVYGGEFFQLRAEDYQSVKNTLDRLNNKATEDGAESQDMPPELKKLLALASLLRVIKGDDKN